MAKKKSSSKAKTKSKTKTKALGKSRAAKSKTTKRKTATKSKPVVSVKALPNLEVETTGGRRLQLSSLKGKNVVLYFYPKDDTPGCTTEGCDLRDHYGELQRLDTVVLGVSRDDLGSHERFKAKFNFPFELITDPEEKLCRALGVIQQKSLYGRTYMGIDRSTFIFDKAGALRKEFRSVKVAGHIDEILQEVRKL